MPHATLKYQLVFQFRGDSLEDLHVTVALEDALREELGNSANVDGHDVGSGETNIFILTADPVATFRRAKPVLDRGKRLGSVTVAYRDLKGERYTVIWPKGSRAAFNVQ